MTVSGATARRLWSAATRAIAESDAYDGLELAPQLGLLPLGPDPQSGLWEFAHAQSGDVPVRDPETGRLAIGEESALVLVLVPGGTFRMGTPTDDARAAPRSTVERRETPPRDVRLDPFFVSKFEMTQGQWGRLTGENPSYHQPERAYVEDLTHPVEMVSWEDCDRAVFWLGLQLPTEAQWEYAARGGTDTVWWTGDDKRTLAGAANLYDVSAEREGETDWPTDEDWSGYDDGYAMHAPVDTLRANGFGLHHVHGNVNEWCREPMAQRVAGTTHGAEGAFEGQAESRERPFRGGAFNSEPEGCRCAARFGIYPEYEDTVIGLRPVRRIEPASLP